MPIIAYIMDSVCYSYPFSYIFICKSTAFFCEVRFFDLYLDILVLLWYCVLLQGGETHEQHAKATV